MSAAVTDVEVSWYHRAWSRSATYHFVGVDECRMFRILFEFQTLAGLETQQFDLWNPEGQNAGRSTL